MQNGLLKEGGFELCFEVHKPVRGQLEVQNDGAVTETRPTQRFEDVGGARQRDKVRGMR